jgi:hypothetical protein
VGQRAGAKTRTTGGTVRRPTSKFKPRRKLTGKTRPEHTRVVDENDDDDDGGEEQEGEDDEEEEDPEDEDENEDHEDAQDDPEPGIEQASLAYEGRLHPLSRCDFGFDLDSMYPCAPRWGAEELRLVQELRVRESARMAREGTVGGSTRASLVAPVVDRKSVIPEMQPEPLVVKTGFNCVVLARIGGVPFRFVLDSGAARSLVRTSFVEQLRKDHRTKSATYGPRPLSRPVVLEGVIKGRQSSTITKATQIGLDLPDTLSGTMGKLEACFGEMND